MNPEFPQNPREEIELRLSALLLGELSEREAAEVRAAIKADPALAKLHDELQQTIHLVRETTAVTSSGGTEAEPKLSEAKRKQLFTAFAIPPLKAKDKKARPLFRLGLVELLAVVAIVAVLAAMMLPALSKAKSKSQRLTALPGRRSEEMVTEDVTLAYRDADFDGAAQRPRVKTLAVGDPRWGGTLEGSLSGNSSVSPGDPSARSEVTAVKMSGTSASVLSPDSRGVASDLRIVENRGQVSGRLSSVADGTKAEAAFQDYLQDSQRSLADKRIAQTSIASADSAGKSASPIVLPALDEGRRNETDSLTRRSEAIAPDPDDQTHTRGFYRASEPSSTASKRVAQDDADKPMGDRFSIADQLATFQDSEAQAGVPLESFGFEVASARPSSTPAAPPLAYFGTSTTPAPTSDLGAEKAVELAVNNPEPSKLFRSANVESGGIILGRGFYDGSSTQGQAAAATSPATGLPVSGFAVTPTESASKDPVSGLPVSNSSLASSESFGITPGSIAPATPSVRWGDNLHQKSSSVGLPEGAVQQLTRARLHEALRNSADPAARATKPLSIESFDEPTVERAEQIKEEQITAGTRISNARALLEANRLEEVDNELKAVLATDPENQTARYYRSFVNESRSRAAEATRSKDLAVKMERSWDFPQDAANGPGVGLPNQVTNGFVAGGGRQGDGGHGGGGKERTSISLRDSFVVGQEKLETRTFDFKADGQREALQPVPRVLVETPRQFDSLNGALASGTGGGGGGGGGGATRDSGVRFLTRTNNMQEVHQAAQKLLKSAGVDLTSQGKTVFYNDREGKLFVRGTKEDLEKVDQVVEALATNRPKADIAQRLAEIKRGNLVDQPEAQLGERKFAGNAQQAKIAQVRRELEELRQQFDISDVDTLAGVPSPSLEAESPRRYQAQLIEASSRLADLEMTLTKLKALPPQELKQALPRMRSDVALTGLMTQLSAAEQQLGALRRDQSVASPDLASAQTRIAELRKQVDENVTNIMTALDNQLESSKAVVKKLQESVATAKQHDIARAEKVRPYYDKKRELEKLLADKIDAERIDQPIPRRAATNAPIPQPEIQTRENNFSTFSLNVSDVSFKLAAASLEQGQMPDVASVRAEEFLNAFDYRDPAPVAGAPVAFAWERARSPFAHNRDLLRFSLKTAAAGRQAGRPLNIVLLLDNSGSMERADRVRIIQEALRVLGAQLNAHDKLSVITFARTAHLVADGVAGDKAAEVTDALSGVTPQGGTNLEEAMQLAYATAARHYAANGINRVVLLTDGAANLGEVEPESLKQIVEAKRVQGIALDCFGIGWEGFNDDLLEVLSRNGDGRYGFINSPEEAATDFVGKLAGALQVAASDVKVQVEFNPQRVTSFRQIGYAKHQLTKEQFRDNTVDAAEIAAQEAGNALYNVEVNPAGEGPLGIVRVRYKIPGTSDYREQAWPVPYAGNAVGLEQASAAMRLATTSSAFAEWLVASPFAGEVTPDRLLGYLSGVSEIYGADARPGKLEWMIRQAKSIEGK